MRRLVLGSILLLTYLLVFSGLALAQPAPEFKLGFKALADQIPDVVGQPLENEHWGANGDSLQQTTKGLMVWRKADNWTAFTNGARTWINGPFGVQERANEERFDWEKAIVAPAPTPVSPAPTPPPPAPTATPRAYSPDVKAMDPDAGGHGVAIKRLMAEVDTEWAQVWGWRPSKPTTVYLYTDGYRMVEGMPSITGRSLSTEERQYFMTRVAGFATRDTQTRGWGVVMNLSNGMGTPYWEDLAKDTLVHEYAHVMQWDVAGPVGPIWYLEGMAQVAAFAKVPSSPALSQRVSVVIEANKKGTLPTLRRLQQDWQGIVQVSPESGAAAYGASYLAVRLLADKVGGAPLLDILKRTARGENFEAALRAVTGYTLEQLDMEYRAKL